MLDVCLTGGIASGKSLVAERFRALGTPVADSDAAARAVVAPGSTGLARVVEAFGSEVLDANGGLDRPALRRRIFSDDAARERLESILHPLIRERIETEMGEWAAQDYPYALRVIPLLMETGMHRSCGRILVVDAPCNVQIRRLMQRDGESDNDARRMLERQASRWQRLEIATDVIDNGDDVDPEIAITPQVLALHRKLTAIAERQSVRAT